MVVEQQRHGHRHPLAQAVVGIVDDHPQPVHQVGAQLAGFDRLRREFSGGRDEAHSAGIDLVGRRVGAHLRGHVGIHPAQVALVDVRADPHRRSQREREDRVAGGDDGSLLAGPREDDALGRGHQVAVFQAALGLDQRGVGGGQLCLARVDVFLARADLGQPQGLLGVVEPCLGFVERGFGQVEILAADGSLAHQPFQPIVVLSRAGQRGPALGNLGMSFGDLFGPRAMFEPGQRGRRVFTLGLGHLHVVLKVALVERGNHRAGVDVIPFVDGQRFDAAGDLERQVDLANVDVAIQHESRFRQFLGLHTLPPIVAASGGHQRNHGQRDRNDRQLAMPAAGGLVAAAGRGRFIARRQRLVVARGLRLAAAVGRLRAGRGIRGHHVFLRETSWARRQISVGGADRRIPKIPVRSAATNATRAASR